MFRFGGISLALVALLCGVRAVQLTQAFLSEDWSQASLPIVEKQDLPGPSAQVLIELRPDVLLPVEITDVDARYGFEVGEDIPVCVGPGPSAAMDRPKASTPLLMLTACFVSFLAGLGMAWASRLDTQRTTATAGPSAPASKDPKTPT